MTDAEGTKIRRNRRVDARLVKGHNSYTAAGLSELLRVSVQAVLLWKRQGLLAVDEQRPFRFKGTTVRAFLEEAKAKRKRPCPAGTMYCFSCKEPRRPGLAMVDFVVVNETGGLFRALCETCGRLMHRRCSTKRMSEVMPGIEIHIEEGHERLKQQTRPSLDHDSVDENTK